MLMQSGYLLYLESNGPAKTADANYSCVEGIKRWDEVKHETEGGMKYKVLITPVQPSVDTHSNFSGVLADYEVDANSESEASDIAFDRFCGENRFRSHKRNDYIINVH
jgi:hypothetical protein